jgi:hypothetical protein
MYVWNRMTVLATALIAAAGCGTVSYVASVDGSDDLLAIISDDEDGNAPAADLVARSGGRAAVPAAEVQAEALPNVVGMTRADAKKTLADAGQWKVLKVRGSEGGYDTGTSTIVSQSPAAGERLELGDKVFVTFPPAPVLEVPNLVGQTETQAREILKAAKFSTRYVKKTDHLVTSQTPAAGEKAPQGSGVKVTVQ